MNTKHYILMILSCLALQSCISNVEDLSENVDVDPATVSYKSNIQPIFSESCGGSGCHINGSTNGVNLSSYTATMNSVGSIYGERIVIPGDASNSPLVDKIEPNPRRGSRMPQGGPYLTNREIAQIRAWIENGAEDN